MKEAKQNANSAHFLLLPFFFALADPVPRPGVVPRAVEAADAPRDPAADLAPFAPEDDPPRLLFFGSSFLRFT